MKELSDKKEVSYVDAQDLLFKEGFKINAETEDISSKAASDVGIAERTVYDNLIEDMRRSLRFYAKQTGQSFFLKIFFIRRCRIHPWSRGAGYPKIKY